MTTVNSVSQPLWQRGSKLVGWLGQLNIVYIIFTILLCLIMIFSMALMGSFAKELGGTSAFPMAGLGIVGVLLTYLPALVGSILYIVAIRAAQRAISSVRDFAAQGQVQTLGNDMQRFCTWLTVGQWLSVVSVLLSLILQLLSQATTSQMLPQAARNSGQGALIITVLLSVGIVALNWVILGSVKGFFQQVAARAGSQSVRVGPAATKAASWLQVSWILTWIATGLLILGGIGILLAIVIGMGASNPLPAEMQMFKTFGLPIILIILALVFGFYGWMISLSLRLLGHSRLFALDVASALDRGGVPVSSPAPDPWGETR